LTFIMIGLLGRCRGDNLTKVALVGKKHLSPNWSRCWSDIKPYGLNLSKLLVLLNSYI